MIFKRILFYIMSFTWGALMSMIGLIVILFSLLFKRVHTYHGRLYAVWGKGWGGIELGCFFVCSEGSGEHTFKHECGHGLQNCLWGPLFPLVIGIPSMIRYWLRTFKTQKSKQLYASILGLAIFLTGLIVALVSVNIVWVIIGVVLIWYAGVMIVWLCLYEVPQYQDNQYIEYDKVWFEGQATRWGNKYVATDLI